MGIAGSKMKNKLSTSINSFFSLNRSNISNLIKDMKLDKADFKYLINRLNNTPRFNDYTISDVKEFSILSRDTIIDLFRDSSIRIKQMFNAADTGGMIINSMISVFSAEIKKLEEELNNLQIFIDNYEFISGKDDLYNANYIEKFDDILSDYRSDNYNFSIPDRDMTSFPAGGNVFVDSFSGMMKVGTNFKVLNIIKNIKSINITNNYQFNITSSTDFKNVFTETLADSWLTTIKSPNILDSKLSNFSKYINYDDSSINGARTVVDVELYSPISIDTIRFLPNLGNDLQILQIVAFNSVISSSSSVNTEDSFHLLLDSPKLINTNIEISFEKTLVNRVIFIFNQQSYTRSKIAPLASELNSKALNSFVEDRIQENKNRFSRNQDIAWFYFKNRYLIDGIKKNKNKDIEYYSYRFPQELFSFEKVIEDEIFKSSILDIDDRPNFSSSPLFINLVRSMLGALNVDNKFFDSHYHIQTNNNSSYTFFENPGLFSYKGVNAQNNPRMQYYSEGIGFGNSTDAVKDLLIGESVDSYEYSFSLRSIDFGETNGTSVDKACFVSKKIPVDGQVSGIKAKVETSNISSITSSNNYDLKNFTSYELSISNIDNPINEADWIPLGFNNKQFIDSEVVFFDQNTLLAKLRFDPKYDSIILYKDGMIVNPDNYNFRIINKRLELLNRTIFNPLSIFCISYEIDDSTYNPFELDLVKNSLYKESVKQFKTSDGLGEKFVKSDLNGTVTLSFTPYVNKTYTNSATYDSYYGTIFTNNAVGYSPVRIRMADGSLAVNLTNYSNSGKKVNFNPSSSVQFIQNGKNITFNKKITTSFTVEYEYVPHSLRFRMIVRKNIPQLDIPGKVDSVLLKMKTVYFDPFYDKISYISTV